MAVIVKIQIIFKKKKIDVSSLANAGYETDEDEILIPKEFVKKLGSIRGHKVSYHTAGGYRIYKYWDGRSKSYYKR